MYECSVEYTTADVPQQTEREYLYPWECLVDASLTFGANNNQQYSTSTTNKVDNNHGEEKIEKLVQNQQDETAAGGGDKTTTTVRCLFTRVYINDIQLMKMGMQEEEENLKQIQKEEEEDEKAKRADSEEQKPQREEIKLTNGGGIKMVSEESEPTSSTVTSSSKSKSREQLKEEGKERKRRKHCQDFENKIRELGFAPGLAAEQQTKTILPVVPAGVIPSSTATTTTLGPLQRANFTHYQSQNYKHHQQFLNFKSPSTSTTGGAGGDGRSRSFSPPDNSGSTNTSGDKSGDKEETEEEREPELSLDERLHFDFGFDPERDQRLVAKSAKRFFAKDKEMMKYWYQRFRFFSRLNQGILLDRQSWFSVTPELLAQHVADRLVRIQDCTVLDAFAGAGGNSIQFALRGAFVFSIDIDPVKLRCSLHNARIYGAAGRCNFICGDFFHIARSMLGARQAKEQSGAVQSLSYDPYPFGLDAVYLSPPWGGPAYRGDEKKGGAAEFDLRRDLELDGVHIFELAKRLTPNIVYFLPKNTSTKQLIALAAPDGKVELEQGSLNGKVKALHAYYGRLVAPEEPQ